MTENTFHSLEAPDSTEPSRRRPLIMAGAAGVVVLGAAGYFLLTGGGSGSTEASKPIVSARHVTAHKATSTVKPKSAAGATSTRKSVLPALNTQPVGRDPFHALYLAPKAAAAGAAAPATATVNTATTTTSNPATGLTANTTPYALTLTGMKLDATGARHFTFSVASLPKTVLPAQRFGKYGELVVLTYIKNAKGAITGALIQVGDDDPVDVSVGEKISVM
jgi:hypothetical protein